MNYKIEKVLKKNKKVFIVGLIIWVLLSILLISPISVSIVEATENGVFNLDNFFDKLFSNFGSIGSNLGKNLGNMNYIGTFWKAQGYLIIAILLFIVVGLIKSMPKNEFTDIEHGSSDWATGEQYSVLSKKKGILLAENHYLPVDKRGNTNVLVVGRIWIW